LRGIRSHGFVVQRSVHSTGRLKSFTAWNAVYRQQNMECLVSEDLHPMSSLLVPLGLICSVSISILSKLLHWSSLTILGSKQQLWHTTVVS